MHPRRSFGNIYSIWGFQHWGLSNNCEIVTKHLLDFKELLGIYHRQLPFVRKIA